MADTTLFDREQSPSMHLKLLKSVALYDDTSAGSALAKRRIALRGSSAARAETRRLLLNAKMELFRVVPVLDDQGACSFVLDSSQPARVG